MEKKKIKPSTIAIGIVIAIISYIVVYYYENYYLKRELFRYSRQFYFGVVLFTLGGIVEFIRLLFKQFCRNEER